MIDYNKLLFSQLHVIIASDYLKAKARQFGEDVVKTTRYAARGQTDLEKIAFDHYVGKLGEEAVRIVLESYGRRVQGPDYGVYDKTKKSWASDLFVNGVGVAVKTQCRTAAKRWGLSWTFHDLQGVKKDPVLEKPNSWVYFVEFVNDTEPENKLIVYPPKQIKDLVFDDPFLDRLKGKKKVVYADYLLEG